MSDALILDGDGTGGSAGAAGLLAPGARLEAIAHGGDLFQGPVWLGDALVWSDLEANTVLAWDADRGTRTWISRSAFQNGHAVDSQGLLYAASHGERAVVRREADGHWVIVADLLVDRRFNAPSDLVVTGEGAVWFTDPRTGLTDPAQGYGGEAEVDGAHVYRVSPGVRRGGVLGGVQCMSADLPAMSAPTGLAFSPDETVLYVTDAEEDVVWGFRVRPDLDRMLMSHRWLVHTSVHGTPRGVRVDPAGRLWVTSSAGVEILGAPPRGGKAPYLGVLRTPSPATNLAFSADHRVLAITTTHTVFLVALGDLA
ncbi:SMP-30/gluconolactonase/LRE family protein [Serinibacter salmoneus]|uniref:Gluconolactonase n=1 Tax=Serinibacter salmoneus TaxID=556530 RepID=A0A2A9D3R8_9MICO|nr:SMP-30/gluconolactonase/LRE family protein [Serinibacter salmoneus]PFG21031.1 gluconolactonase [Serinibacter salmoneus]